MKRRRRLNTQTINRKKRTTSVRVRPQQSGENGLLKFFKRVLYAVVLIAIVYGGYQYLLPFVKEKLPALEQITSPAAQKTVEEQPTLPMESGTVETPTEEDVVEENSFVRAIQVEILNGCGEQGIARVLADKLRNLKYDVVNTGNYLKNGKPYFEVKSTRVIDQVNSDRTRDEARKLARKIGIPEKQVQSFSNPNPVADITIIIGQDFQSLTIFKGNTK